MRSLNWLDWVCLILLIVGGLNWGLVGIFDFNFVSLITGNANIIERIIYILVGLSSLYVIGAMLKKGGK